MRGMCGGNAHWVELLDAGMVETMKICRAGAFSCPVACGVVLLGKVNLTNLQDLSPAELQQTLQVCDRADLLCF